jgi:hypothetical protein
VRWGRLAGCARTKEGQWSMACVEAHAQVAWDAQSRGVGAGSQWPRSMVAKYCLSNTSSGVKLYCADTV